VSIPTTGRVLCLDWGAVRFGLAVSDETQLIASPLVTLTRRPGKRFQMPALLDQIQATIPVGLVVGLPLEPSGLEGESAAAARELATRIGQRTGLPVELVDERMSTARALGAIAEQGGSTRGRKGDVDALAAAVILQQFLDRRRPRT
jgi:putative Holliday junction resolvase